MAGLVLVAGFASRPATAATGVNKSLNLQGRLLTSAGAIVPDGSYNFRVRIYQDGDGVLGGGDETLKWTELWQNAVATGSSAPVIVKNGYFSINLGSYCAFAGGSCQGTTNTGVDFNQTILWASLDIGGTSVGTSPTYDGEMTPFRRLSSAVYALQAENANTLGGLSSSGFIQNSTTVQAGANIYVRSAATGSVVSVLEGANGQTADLLDFNTYNGTTSTTVAKFTAAGNLQVAASIDTVTGTSLAVGGTNATGVVVGKNTGTTTTTVQSGSGGYSLTSTGNGSVTANGSITVTAGGGSTWSTSAGNLIVQAGGTDELRLQTGGAGIVALGDQNSTTIRIGRGSNIARTIDIGTAGTSQTQTISIGSTGGASVLNLKSGSGGILINDSVNNAVSVNSGTSTGTLTLGNALSPLTVLGNGAATSTTIVGLRVAADTNDRFQIRADGGMLWGPGNAGTDITLSRTAAQVLTVNQSFIAAGNLTAGSGSIAGVAKLSVQPAAASTTGAVIRGASGVTQTASLLELQEGLSGSNYVNAYFSASGNQLTLGRIAATGTNTQGKLVLADGTADNFGLTLQSSTLTASRTYSFPDSPGNTTDTICLLTLSNCSTGTLQGAYGNDVDGSDTIISLTTADDSLIFRNPAASGTDSTFVLTVDQLATGAKGGLDIQSAGTGSLLRVRDTTATAADVFTIADGGAVTFNNQTNSTSAFLIQNAAGAQAIKVDTTADSGNLVSNGSFEANTTGWAGKGTGSVSRITSSSFSGVAAMSVTTAAANDGAKYNLTLAVSTQYTINFMAQATGAGFSTMNYGYSVDGTTESDCKTAQNPVTTGFKIFTCTFTTTATAPSGTPYIYIKQTDGTARTFYVDAFQIRAGSSAGVYRETAATVSSAVTSAFGIQPTIDSSLAFNVESADGSTLLAVDSVNKRLGIGTQAPSAYFHVARTTSNDATVMARINTTSTQSGDLLQFFDDSATAVLSKFGADADLTIKPQADMAGVLQVQNAAGTTTAFNVDTSAGTTTINGGAGGSTTALVVNSNATTNAGLLVKGIASQSEDLFNIRNSANTKLFSVKSDGATFIGTDPGGTNTLAIRNGSFAGTNIGLLIQAHGSQSVNLLQLQDSSANINAAFNAAGNQLSLGRVAASGTVTQGKLLLADGTTDNFGLTVQSATLTASRTYSFPDSPGNATDTVCLLTLANCSGSATTLQNTYAADADGGDAVISLTTADDSIILRNPASGGSDSAYILTLDQLATGARGGLSVQSAGTGNLLLLTDTTTTARDVLTVADGGATTFRNQTNSVSALKVTNANGVENLINVDTTNSVVSFNYTTPGTYFGNGYVNVARSGYGFTHTNTGAVTQSTWVGNEDGLDLGSIGTETTSAFGIYTDNAKVTFAVLASGNTNIGRDSADYIGTNSAQLQVRSSTASEALLKITDATAADFDVLTVADEGAVTLKTRTNTPGALTVQNSAGSGILTVDSTPDSGNLISNSSFETGTTGWLAKGTASGMNTSTAQKLYGNNSLIFTSNATGDGVKYNTTLTAATLYTLTGYVRGATSATTSMSVGYAFDGSTESTYTCTSISSVTTGWTRFTCQFTPASVSGTPYLYVKATSSTVRTFYLDAVTLSAASGFSEYLGEGAIRANAQYKGQFTIQNGEDSTRAFAINTANSTDLLVVDTLNQRIGIKTSTPNAVLDIANSADTLLKVTDTSGTDTDALLIDATGTASFTNNVDSATGFRIQNASSVAMFTVDTSAARIYVGPTAGDTVGTILVLGNKTNAGDPTGVEGAIYYNSSRDSFRCYQNGEWQDCVRRARNLLYVYSDFTSKGSDNYFIDSSSGTGATVSGSAATPLANHPGIIRLMTGTTTTGAADEGDLANFILANGDAYTFESNVYLPALSDGTNTFTVRSGFKDQAFTESQDGCFFRYTHGTNSGKWQGVCRSNNTESTCDSTITVAATTWYRLGVSVNSTGTSADFQTDGVSRCQVASNIPTGSTRYTGFGSNIIKSAGTTSSSLDVDYMEIVGQLGTSR